MSLLASNIASLNARAAIFQNTALYDLAIGNTTLLRRGLKVDVIDKFNERFNKAFRDDDYVGDIRTTSTIYIVLSIIILIVLMLILLCLLCLANRGPKGLSKGLRIFAQFIIIVQLIFAITILILGIVLIFAGVYIFYCCEIIDGVINNRDYIRNNLPKVNSDYPAMNAAANECVYRNGNGFLINALGANTSYIDLSYGQSENVLTG